MLSLTLSYWKTLGINLALFQRLASFQTACFPSSCGQQHKHKSEGGFLKGEKSLARNKSWTRWEENKYHSTELQSEISISIQQNTFIWRNSFTKNESGARSFPSFLIYRLCICESSWIPGEYPAENQQTANRIKGGCKLLFSFCCKVLFNFPNAFHFFPPNTFFFLLKLWPEEIFLWKATAEKVLRAV